MASPSKLRREGREAFENGHTRDQCPYILITGSSDWLEGYDKAEEEAKQDHINQKAEEDEFDIMAASCPWNSGGDCEARAFSSVKLCCMEQCALYYFKNL